MNPWVSCLEEEGKSSAELLGTSTGGLVVTKVVSVHV